jgi:hypothetical protein
MKNTIRNRVILMTEKCTRCHRTLKDPISIERKLGPICFAKLKALNKDSDQYSSPYDGGDIILRRVDGVATANVPHSMVYHSPSGFEWGYAGSGPADLALNILFAVTGDRDLAMKFHQEFKQSFIVGMPEDGGVIEKDRIIKWLELQEEHLPAGRVEAGV